MGAAFDGEVVRCAAGDPAVRAFLEARDTAVVARRGELVDAREHPTLVAQLNGHVVGVLTYVIVGGSCEVLTLHAARRIGGIGTALVAALAELAVDAGCTTCTVTTTNDNVDALRFYQRRGFRLAELRPGAVDRARTTVKPSIGRIGDHGIPLRDELELVRHLGGPENGG